MNNAITTTSQTAISKEYGMTPNQLGIITNSVAKGASVDELRYFLMVAKRSGLDPFTKQIHFVKRKSRNMDGSYSEIASIQTGIDGYRAIAEKTKTLAGIDDAIYDSEDQPHPNKATVTVYRMVDGQKVPFTASARWSEYCQTRTYQGQTKPMGLWEKMPYLMLSKCAEALALRKAFPNDLSGIYTEEEMGQATGNEPEITIPKQPESEKPAHQEAIEGEVEQTDVQDKEEAVEGKIEPNNDYICSATGVKITRAEFEFSTRHFGMPLSREAQRKAREEQQRASK